MTREMNKIIVTGAAGQIGSELTLALRRKHGRGNVLATDIKPQIDPKLRDSGPYKHLDVLEGAAIAETIVGFSADTIFHMSAILSASGEKKPQLAWNVNLNGTFNVLKPPASTAWSGFSYQAPSPPSAPRHPASTLPTTRSSSPRPCTD
jgi:nucleoside-diphosphate-sugar epimerase